jgi:lambda family phage portal protein
MSKDSLALQKAMKPNVIDKIIHVFDPIKGYRRQQARTMSAISGSYSGAKRSGGTMKNWFTSSNDANSDILPELPLMRSRSRDLVRNHPIASGAINTVTTNVVGSGLTLQSSIDAEFLRMSEEEAAEWQANTEREFKLWSESKSCDITRTQNFAGLQDLAFRSSLENGDSFGLLPMVGVKGSPYKTRIQLIESDRICNEKDKRDSSTLAGGISIDQYGAPELLHVLKSHPGGIGGQKKEWSKIRFFGKDTGRSNVIQLFDRRRIGQLRGVPYLAPVIEPLKQLGRYTDAELMAAVVSGLFTVFVKSEAGSDSLLTGDDVEGKSRDYELGQGSIIEGLPGDSIETIDAGRPNKEFSPFVDAILMQVGVALELPKEVLAKVFLSSYSAARAALLDAWKFFSKRRRVLAVNFCQPIYEAWLEEAVSIGRVHAPGFFTDPLIRKAYCGALWHGDGPGAIDPLKEANAIDKRLEMNLTSLAEEKAGYDGGDWEQTVKQRKKERDVIGDTPEPNDKRPEEEPFNPDNPQ